MDPDMFTARLVEQCRLLMCSPVAVVCLEGFTELPYRRRRWFEWWPPFSWRYEARQGDWCETQNMAKLDLVYVGIPIRGYPRSEEHLAIVRRQLGLTP